MTHETIKAQQLQQHDLNATGHPRDDNGTGGISMPGTVVLMVASMTKLKPVVMGFPLEHGLATFIMGVWER